MALMMAEVTFSRFTGQQKPSRKGTNEKQNQDVYLILQNEIGRVSHTKRKIMQGSGQRTWCQECYFKGLESTFCRESSIAPRMCYGIPRSVISATFIQRMRSRTGYKGLAKVFRDLNEL